MADKISQVKVGSTTYDIAIPEGYVYAGIAHITDASVTPTQNCFYIATEVGTYSGYSSLTVAEGEVAIFKYNALAASNNWSKDTTGINQVTISQNIQTGGYDIGVADASIVTVNKQMVFDMDAIAPLPGGEKYSINGTGQSYIVKVTHGADAGGDITLTTDSTDHNIAVEAGVNAVYTLTFSAAATTAGKITITLNGKAFEVAVEGDETTSELATLVASKTFEGYTATASSAVVTFTASTAKAENTCAYSAGSTGATATIANSTEGEVNQSTAEAVATAIAATTITGWTLKAEGANVIMTKTTIGLSASTITFADTDTTGVTASVSLNANGTASALSAANTAIVAANRVNGMELIFMGVAQQEVWRWNGSTFTTASNWRSISCEVSELGHEVANIHPITDEAGYHVVDAEGNIGMQYTEEGFDAAKVTEHFKALVGSGSGGNDVVDVEEDGFFVADGNNNIGLKLTNEGLDFVGKDGLVGKAGRPSNVFYFAASDSTENDKKIADYVCSGNSGNTAIQSVIDATNTNIKIVLLPGTYYFTPNIKNGDTYTCLLIPRTSKRTVEICGYFNCDKVSATFTTKVKINKTVFDTLSNTTKYTMISGTRAMPVSPTYMGTHLFVKDLEFSIWDCTKNIICVDGFYFGQLSATDCTFITENKWTLNYLSVITDFAEGCIAMRLQAGAGNGCSIVERCVANGFYIGFSISGEHTEVHQLGAARCCYGFWFQGFTQDEASADSKVSIHKMSCNNICDEACQNYPYFDKNPYQQSIDITNYHAEIIDSQFTQGGNYAKEAVAGQWRGTFTYEIDTIQRGNRVNEVGEKLIEDGHLHGMVCRNLAQYPAATTTERNSWYPTYMQQVYDLTLNKLLICTDTASKTWRDTNGTII